MPPPAPFIVGTGRSGTTLLRLMLDAHPQLAIPPETEFAAALHAFNRKGVAAAIDAVVSTLRWGDFNIPAGEFVARARGSEPTSFADLMRVLYRFYAERRGKPRWGDKSPYYVRAIAAIYRHLPEARFVHVIRDGRDVAISMMPLWFGPDDLAETARWWSETIEIARQQAAEVPHYKEILYERLVVDPVGTLREVCDFLELDWEPAMLEYHRDADRRLNEETGAIHMPGRTVSRDERMDIHRFLGSPPRRDRLERWRQEMSPAERRPFERIAGDMLEQLGYEVDTRG